MTRTKVLQQFQAEKDRQVSEANLVRFRQTLHHVSADSEQGLHPTYEEPSLSPGNPLGLDLLERNTLQERFRPSYWYCVSCPGARTSKLSH